MADFGQKNDTPPSWSGRSKTAALWVLIGLLSILAVQFIRGQEERAASFTYSEFRQQLDANNVAKVTVIDQRRMTGELRKAVSRGGQDMTAFQTTLPGDLTPQLEEKLLAQGVVMEGKRD